MNTKHFLQNLFESQLVSADQLEIVRSRFEAQGLDSDVAANLIKEGVLTAYQVERLEAGESNDLVLGQYRILEELGRGGFGRVYKAAHALMDRAVALKVIAPERVADERARAMFLREVRAATRLHHPTIAVAYDAGEADGRLFMAMEYVEGPNLDQLVRKQGPLPVNLAWPMLQQAAQALRCAHEHGMVHRDIKPANLLIPKNALNGAGRSGLDAPALVKIVDFGLARLQSQEASGTIFAGKDRMFAGTPDFVSPEQARNLHDVDIRSDLYSLGCTFYFALAGRKPFHGANALEIVLQHFETEAEPLERLRPDVPPALAGLIRRLMEKQPDRRFQNPNDLLAEMGFLHGGGSQPVVALPSLPSFPTIALPPAPPLDPGPTLRKSGAFARPALPERELSATVQMPGVDAVMPPMPIAPAWSEDAPSLARAEAGAATQIALDTQEEPVPVTPPTMTTRPGNDLRRAWSQWHAIVAAVVQGQEVEVDAAAYRAVHGRLLREVRAYSTSADEAQRARCRRLEAMVEPWLTLQALATTEPGTLRDLAARSAALGHAMGLRAGAGGLPVWVVMLVVFLLALPLGAMASLQVSSDRLAWHLPTLQSAWHFIQTHPVLALTLLLPGTVLGGLYGLGRLARG